MSMSYLSFKILHKSVSLQSGSAISEEWQLALNNDIFTAKWKKATNLAC